jgi:hypothetical protein
MELPILQFSLTFPHFIPLISNILLNTLFSNTLNMCSPLNLRDQLSNPHKTTGKFMVLYILISTTQVNRREDKRF